MKRLIPHTILIILLIAIPAAAQIDPDPDGIGIYADLEGLTNSVALEVGQPLEVYLLLTRPSQSGYLMGWQCGIEVPENVSIWGWYIPGTFVNVGVPPAFAVGRAQDPTYLDGSTILLMTFILQPQDGEEAVFMIDDGGWWTPYQGLPIYATGVGDENMHAMHPYPSGPGRKAFVVNEAVANASLGWSEVKRLYR